MRTLVTGAAGFIGSRLSTRLLEEGHEVLAIDSFTPYYPRALKERHLEEPRSHDRFTLLEQDLNQADLDSLLNGVDAVFHQAGQPGVRASWGASFDPYIDSNIRATQHLLEAAARAPHLNRFVYASSSSIYGDATDLPVTERTLPRPVSPYGVTKLAAEHLATLYAGLGVHTVSLRYFTVYGPGQRPDMAFHRFISAVLAGDEVTINGDGEQSRDFTYVDDIVEANLQAATRKVEPGSVYNLAGGSIATVNQVIALIEDITGRRARTRHVAQGPGEARHTSADTSAAARDLGFAPTASLEEGLAQQVASLAH